MKLRPYATKPMGDGSRVALAHACGANAITPWAGFGTSANRVQVRHSDGVGRPKGLTERLMV